MAEAKSTEANSVETNSVETKSAETNSAEHSSNTSKSSAASANFLISTTKKIFHNNVEIINLVNNIVGKLVEIFNINNNNYILSTNKKIEEFEKLNELNSKILEKLTKENQTTDNSFELLNSIQICSMILKKIQNGLQTILDKSKSIETLLSRTFIDDTVNFHKKIVLVYSKTCKDEYKYINEIINEIVTNEIIYLGAAPTSETIISYIKKIQKLYYQNIFAIDLYTQLINRIIVELPRWIPDDKQIIFYIKYLIELDKSKLFNNEIINNKEIINKPISAALNPYFKTFNLIPVTKLINIEEVSQLMFGKNAKNLAEFLKNCKDGDYGLIIINRQMPSPITYDMTKLLDWKEAQEFSNKHKPNYGVDELLIDYTETIEKVTGVARKTKWKFNIETHLLTLNDYENEKYKYVIVLDSLANDQYRINSNFLSMGAKYFIKISTIYELYNHCGTSKLKKHAEPISRVASLNKIKIKNALPHIFCPIKIDMNKVNDISIILDPKYLRNEIYLRINEQFKDIIKKKYGDGNKIKDNYTYAAIIHNEDFLIIFSNIITREFHSYLYGTYSDHIMGHIRISEVISSFLNTIYLYQRMFVKEIHDYFKNNLFNFEDINIPIRLKNHFDEMTKCVLNKIITNESNVYQTILYKINLLKNTFV